MKKLNVALVGCWHPHVPRYYPILQTREDTALSCVWDSTPERGRAWAEKLGNKDVVSCLFGADPNVVRPPPEEEPQQKKGKRRGKKGKKEEEKKEEAGEGGENKEGEGENKEGEEKKEGEGENKGRKRSAKARVEKSEGEAEEAAPAEAPAEEA